MSQDLILTLDPSKASGEVLADIEVQCDAATTVQESRAAGADVDHTLERETVSRGEGGAGGGLEVRLPLFASVLGSWGKAMRDAVRNTERWKRRRAPTQYPSTS